MIDNIVALGILFIIAVVIFVVGAWLIVRLANNYPYWLCSFQTRFDAGWDDILNRYIDKGNLKSIDVHTMTFSLNKSDIRVWVANFPYSYASYEGGSYSFPSKLRPSRKTIRRLRAYELEVRDAEVQRQAEHYLNG